MTANLFDHPAQPYRFSNKSPMGCNCRDWACADLRPATHRHRSTAGFTLIEITVVVFLIGILLLVAMPRLPEAPLTDHTRKASRWLVYTVKELKQRSVREQKTYSLQLDMDANRFWIIREDMSEEEKLAAEEEAYRPGDNVRITDVEFPQRDQVTAGRSEIRFYPRGYSDRAIIHIDDGKQRYSFRVEPFLSSVKIYETYVGYKKG
jgi:prepilin-type N-terminal cleavage/methylation domain-containing protein